MLCLNTYIKCVIIYYIIFNVYFCVSLNKGYFLESMFWTEFAVKLVSFGELRLFRDFFSSVRLSLNLLSLSLYCLVGTEPIQRRSLSQAPSSLSLSLLAVLCLRLVSVCIRVRGQGRYATSLSAGLRSVALLFLSLYFFMILGEFSLSL